MNIQNMDTQDLEILALLRREIPEESLSMILASLRHDRHVWGALKDPAFRDKVETNPPSAPVAWTPAYLGLLALEADFSPADIRHDFERQVEQALLVDPHSYVSDTGLAADHPWAGPSALQLLSDATRICLWMRSKIDADNSAINQVIVHSDRLNILPTALACLYDLTSDPFTWLANLIEAGPVRASIDAALHCLLSNPIGVQLRADFIFGLLQDRERRLQILVLQRLQACRPSLAAEVAEMINTRNPADNSTIPGNGVYELVAGFERAELYGIAGREKQASESWAALSEKTRALQADFLSRRAWIAEQGNPTEEIENSVVGAWEQAYRLADQTPLYRARFALALFQAGQVDEAKTLLASSREASAVLYARAYLAWHDEETDASLATQLAQEAVRLLERDDVQTRPLDFQFGAELTEFLVEIRLPGEAIGVLQPLLALRPDNPRLLRLMGQAYFVSQNYEAAIAAFRLASALDPGDLEVFQRLAEALEASGNWEEALLERSKIFELIDSPSIDELRAFAHCALRAGEAEVALRIGEQALLTDPTNGRMHALLGEAQFELGNTAKALELLKQSTQLAPAEDATWLTLASVQGRSGRPHLALDTLRTARHACPDSAQIRFQLGEMFLKDNSPTKALPHLRQAFDLAHGEPAIELRLGQTLNQLGHFEEAAEVLSFAYHTLPGNSEISLAYATSLHALERWREALAPLSGLVHSGDAPRDAYVQYAESLLALGEGISDAVDALNHILDSKDDDIKALALLAEANMALGDFEQADKLYQKLLDFDLNEEAEWRIRIVTGLATAALQSDDSERAIAVLSDAVKDSPDEAPLYVLLCEANAAAGLRENALSAARQALSHDPQSLEMLTWFAENAIGLGAVSEAYGALRQAQELAPKRSDLIVLLAKVQKQAGEHAEAKVTLSQLTALENADQEDVFEAGMLLMELGEPWKAVECLEHVIERIDLLPAAHYHLMSKAYQQVGDEEKSITVLEEAIKLEPDNPELHVTKAKMLLAQDRAQAAQACMDRAFQLRPNDLGLLQEAVKIQRVIGNYEAALELSERRLKADPENLVLRHQAADLSRSLLQFQYAVRILGKGWPASFIESTTDPQHSTKIGDLLPYFCLKAEIYLQLGDEPAAAEALKEAIRIEGSSLRALANLARLHATNGRYEAAQELFERIWSSIDPQQETEEDKERETSVTLDRLLALPLAAAASAVGFWRRGTAIMEGVLRTEPLDPYANLEYARLIVLRAEAWQKCEDLEISSHSPGSSAVSKLSRQLFEKSIANAEAVHESGQIPEDLMRWKIRGASIFHPDSITAQRLRTLPPDPENAAALISVLKRVGDLEGIQEAAQLYPDHPYVAFQTALALVDQDPETGSQLARLALEARPEDPQALALNAKLAARSGDLDQAIASMQTALEIWPDEPNWHAQLGRWIERAKRIKGVNALQEAIVHLQKAVDLDSQEVSHRLDLGRIYMAAGQHERAVSELEYASGLNKGNHEVFLALASAYKNGGHFDQATSAIEQAMALAPEDVRGHLVHAKLALEQSMPQDALDRVGAALRIAPDNPESFHIRAAAFEALNRPSEALEALEKALEHTAQPLPLLLDRVRLLDRAKGRSAALRALQEASDGFPASPEIQQQLAIMLASQNRPEEAILAAKHALRLGSDTLPKQEVAALHMTLGRLLRNAGQQDQAIHHLSEAVNLESESLEPYLELGRTFIERRELDQAVAVYQKAIEQKPEDPRAYYQAGLALKERKDYLEAEEMLRHAAELLPNDLGIHRQLGAVVALNIVHNNGKAAIDE